jgi:fimbrial chaperone protein
MIIFSKILNINLSFNKKKNATVLGFITFIFPLLVNAASWEIDQVRIDLSQKKQTNVLTIKNTSDSATSIQIQVLLWSQNDEEDNFESTRDLVVSPSFVTLPPKSEQIIRTKLRRSADQNKELTYRMNLVEIAPVTSQEFNGVKVLMKVGVPVFVEPLKGKDDTKILWVLEKKPDNQIKVTLVNQGHIHLKILDFSLYLKGDKEVLSNQPITSYVMGAQSRSWLIKQNLDKNITNEKINIKAHTDRGLLESDVYFTSN